MWTYRVMASRRTDDTWRFQYPNSHGHGVGLGFGAMPGQYQSSESVVGPGGAESMCLGNTLVGAERIELS